jgi:hypothetical protein
VLAPSPQKIPGLTKSSGPRKIPLILLTIV